MGENRRNKILKLIANQSAPLSASKLAQNFNVSRQVIVGDVALLRAAGHPITATARGYIMFQDHDRFIAKIAVNHTQEQTEEELSLIVGLDAYVLDVTVDHPIYGEITGQLDIRSLEDVASFMKSINSGQVELLSILTQGTHLHTISCESKAHYNEVLEKLSEHGFLVDQR